MQRDFLQPLPTNAISWYELPFATKLGLLQRFLVVAQGLEVCSGGCTQPQRQRRSRPRLLVACAEVARARVRGGGSSAAPMCGNGGGSPCPSARQRLARAPHLAAPLCGGDGSGSPACLTACAPATRSTRKR